MEFPEFLYRYRPAPKGVRLKEELERAFKKSEIRCTPIAEMNDPLDSRPVLDKSSLKEVASVFRKNRLSLASKYSIDEFHGRKIEKKRLSKISPVDNARRFIAASESRMKEFRSRVMIGCFSEVWDSTLMWSHYTNAHAGVCIKYKVSTLLFIEPKKHPMPVNYTAIRSRINIIDLLHLTRSLEIKNPQNRSTKSVLDALIYEKSVDWSYEKEWRVARFWEKNPDYFSFPPLEAVGVILGANATEETEALVRANVSKKAEITRLKLHPTEYKLVVAE